MLKNDRTAIAQAKRGRPFSSWSRYKKVLPVRLALRFKKSLEDPCLLELRQEIALCDARQLQLLEYIKYVPDYDPSDTEESVEEKMRRGELTEGSVVLWKQIWDVMERRQRFVESERRRLIELQQYMTIEQASVLVACLVEVVKRHVEDEEVLESIGRDINALDYQPPGQVISTKGPRRGRAS